MSKSLALVIDDEPDIRELLEITLGRMGIDTESAASLRQAEAMVESKTYDLCLTDMRLTDGNGIDFVKRVQRDFPNMPVAVITAHGNMDTAIEAMKAGAFDFISKPVELEDLRKIAAAALRLQQQPSSKASPNLLGEAPSFQSLKKKIVKLARSQAPVFISGESGTGKELVARAIHEQGPRAAEPFVPVNCGAIPGELMESEFFGHRKGSFTGATADKQGLFQAANGGTLFLDEVADLPLDMQVKLLRAIQEKAVRPVGSQQEDRIDVRILSATHKDLNQEIREGRFRNDLFYRINVIQLDIPPLRERLEDIEILARHFLQRFADELDLPAATLAKEGLRALHAYPFPGNIRELENILERAYTLCDSDIIGPADLHLPDLSTQVSEGTTPHHHGPITGSLDDYLESIERDVITRALDETRWNRTAAARKLGVSFRSLRYRLKKLGLDAEADG
ncbi:sigma-54-dependent transcriptional regulator [Gilvimarinus sp. F26214L]|uniref:sigma-54-dependent transcriptional regulator n=1 Tax=Gilvimarinus sp. DZF01 TaxID=3461371 RepID=UPI004045D2B3